MIHIQKSSRLDSWIVQVFHSCIVLAWSLKNGEAFWTPSFFFLCATLQAYLIGIGASICNSRESWCILYAVFLVLLFIKLNMSVYCVVNNSDNIEHLTGHIANSSADIFDRTDIYCLLSGLLAL